MIVCLISALQIHFSIYHRKSIPRDMFFDPNGNPPCYRTEDEVLLQFTVKNIVPIYVQ